jgi:hypothetical protein
VYNLLMVSARDYWLESPSSMPRSRFGEYTSESLRQRYATFTPDAIRELQTFPSLFAYEHPVGQAARLGRITRITQPSGPDIRFAFELFDGVPAITTDLQTRIAWDLDLGEWEINRTHWAVKDVDLLDVLRRNRILPLDARLPGIQQPTAAISPPTVPLPIRPSVFAIPTTPQSTTLVAVMMPFASSYDSVYAGIESACQQAGLESQRADKVWEDSTIIQDIFSLIYRSRIVVADLSDNNPNVLYEVGIAHTLGRPVVPIAQEAGNRPFDIAHHRILGYQASAEGLSTMVAKLTSRLRYLAG